MLAFERLLVPGCTELPECRCGKEMRIAGIERLSEKSDANIRVYRCPACNHEMRLTVWVTDAEA
jgi:DNA-directed RNA polymerase subunit RPC12/RpoP